MKIIITESQMTFLKQKEFVMSMVFSTTEDDKPSALWNYQILYM